MEESPRLWRAHCSGGAYEYSYRTGGEVVAFLVGWSELLEQAAGSALAARAISLNVNTFLLQRFSNQSSNTFAYIAPVNMQV